MASEGYHEPYEKLSVQTRDMHRAITSLMEEFEAVDWYQQRVDAVEDKELQAILAHNRDEEKEHAAMVLEWIRRHDDVLGANLKEYVFTAGSIVGREATSSGREGAASSPSGTHDDTGKTPTVGSLKGSKS